MTVLSVQAQNFPVGIASVQDSVKSAQVGLLSSVAISQMKGFQFGGFANMSAAPINTSLNSKNCIFATNKK